MNSNITPPKTLEEQEKECIKQTTLANVFHEISNKLSTDGKNPVSLSPSQLEYIKETIDENFEKKYHVTFKSHCSDSGKVPNYIFDAIVEGLIEDVKEGFYIKFDVADAPGITVASIGGSLNKDAVDKWKHEAKKLGITPLEYCYKFGQHYYDMFPTITMSLESKPQPSVKKTGKGTLACESQQVNSIGDNKDTHTDDEDTKPKKNKKPQHAKRHKARLFSLPDKKKRKKRSTCPSATAETATTTTFSNDTDIFEDVTFSIAVQKKYGIHKESTATASIFIFP